MRRRASFALAVPVIALMLSVTACSTTPAAPPSGGGSNASADAYQQAFDDHTRALAACMRGRGVDVEDPASGTAITLDGSDVSAAVYDACALELGPPPVDPDQPTRKEISDELLLRAQCLRDRGFDVPDPDANGAWDLPEELFDEARACGVQ